MSSENEEREENNPKMVTEYLEIDREYVTKYGENVAIMYQNGSFLEFWGDHDRMYKICYEGMNINIRKMKDRNIYTGGFPITSEKKYRKLLIESNYIVVTYKQQPDPKNSKKIIRVFSEKFSGTTSIENEELIYENQTIMCILIEYIDGELIDTNICTYEPSTGVNNCIIGKYQTYLEIQKCINNINPKQIIIYTDGCIITSSELTQLLNIQKRMLHIRSNSIPSEFKKINYQNQFLNQIFDPKLITAIEYLNLDRYPSMVLSYILLLSFIHEFDPLFLNKFALPKINFNNTNLDLSTNCIEQLNLADKNKNSLFNIINNTSTLGGKRLLKQQLLAPSIDKNVIQNSYDNIEKILTGYEIFETQLVEIYDLEKLNRRIHLTKLKPIELTYLSKSYIAAKELIKLSKEYNLVINILNEDDIIKFEELINYVDNTIEMKNSLEYSETNEDCNRNIFKKGYNAELDKYFDYNSQLHSFLDNLALQYGMASGKNEALKFEPSKAKKQLPSEEYQFHVTDKQKQKLKETYSDLEFTSRASGSKMTSKTIRECSEKIIESQNSINTITKNLYLAFLTYLSTNYNNIMEKIAIYSNTIDVIKSNAKTAVINKYCKPIINDLNKAFINAEKIRHPIIEKVNSNVQYVANDCHLGDVNDGMLIYSINGCGKSSYAKSIAISIIMAQAGMFVPATSFTYGIYKRIITKISGGDDLYASKSFFVNEALKIKEFLDFADSNTLIIGDEIFNGTENSSEISLVASTIKFLADKRCSFIFLTHLHELVDLEIIKDCKNVKIYHITANITNDKIIYERIVKEGKSDKLYGIEISSFLGLNQQFIKDAYNVRNLLLEKNNSILPTKTSNYNNSLYMDHCKICGIENNLITHHITEQNEFKERHKIPFEKNAPHNLVVICEKCHYEVHNGKIKIKGYKQSTNGIILDYMRL
jgi:DNA mismatch repair protein MutS